MGRARPRGPASVAGGSGAQGTAIRAVLRGAHCAHPDARHSGGLPGKPVQHSLNPWLARWDLTPDGAPFATHTSVLLPVLAAGQPAMLKIATSPEEARGAAVLAWWGGEGAARVLALEGDALDKARMQAQMLVQQAINELDELPPSAAKDALVDLAQMIVDRTF